MGDEHQHSFTTPLVIQLEAGPWLTGVLHKIISNQEQIMAKLDDLQAAVTAEDTVIDSAVTLINGLAAQIAALPAEQGAIDALAADVKARSSALATAVQSGTTPPAPTA